MTDSLGMRKKKIPGMTVLEFAKFYKNKGEESPQQNNMGMPYKDLKNFNWIKERQERPCTRGETRPLDFSF